MSPASPGVTSVGQDDTEAEATTATWGERYTWDNGLAVEVSKPVSCKPSQYASPEGVKRAVKVTVKVINSTEEEFDAGLLAIGSEAQFGGKTAESVIDYGGGCGDGMDVGGTVLPGKTFTTEMVFSVGAKPGELQLVLQPTLGASKAVYVGQA